MVLLGDPQRKEPLLKLAGAPCEAQSPGLGNRDAMGPLDEKGPLNAGGGEANPSSPKHLREQLSCCAALLQSEFAQRPSPHWKD